MSGRGERGRGERGSEARQDEEGGRLAMSRRHDREVMQWYPNLDMAPATLARPSPMISRL